jgi:prepilin-type N-terminal cleavage/methylation domain-containing protein
VAGESPAHAKRRPYHIYGAVICSLCFGLAGSGYGAFLYYHPEYRETIIQRQLSRPHFDSRRYVASILALRYQGFFELALRSSIIPLIVGAIVGAGIGSFVGWKKNRRLSRPADDSPRFTLVEMLMVLGIVAILLAFALPGARAGCVYYDGKDQFYWLEIVERGQGAQRKKAIAALCKLLEGRPFPCRSTIIPTIAKCGSDAKVAIPVLKTLTADSEESVRIAAVKALATIADDPEKPGALPRMVPRQAKHKAQSSPDR